MTLIIRRAHLREAELRIEDSPPAQEFDYRLIALYRMVEQYLLRCYCRALFNHRNGHGEIKTTMACRWYRELLSEEARAGGFSEPELISVLEDVGYGDSDYQSH